MQTALGEKLNGVELKMTQKAGVDGRLFGSVTNVDVAEALRAQGYEVTKVDGVDAIRPDQDHRRNRRQAAVAHRCDERDQVIVIAERVSSRLLCKTRLGATPGGFLLSARPG